MGRGLNSKVLTITSQGVAGSSNMATLQTTGRIRSFIFFNNSSHNMTLFLGGASTNPDGAVVPASTSVKMDYHDLIGLNFYRMEVTGTANDTALVIWVEDGQQIA